MRSTLRYAAFAMEFADDAEPLARDVIALSWTVDALKIFKQIQVEANANSKKEDEDGYLLLPYARLRAQLHTEVDGWVSLDDSIGLRNPYVPPDGNTSSWGFLSGEGANSIEKAETGIRDAFASWSEVSLAQYCDNRSAFPTGIVVLRELNQNGRLVHVGRAHVNILPWDSPAKKGDPTKYDVTAGTLANRLAGCELFPELGPVVRVMGGGSERNSAEVMTRPSRAADGRFSLVCEITVETLPGSAKPLIYCRFKRRRWAKHLKTDYPASSSIGGFVFPHRDRPHSAFRFGLFRRGGKWVTDLAYKQYEYSFGLVPNHEDQCVLAYPCGERASVVVMAKYDVAEDSQSKLQAGVPLADQADAFQRITEVLRPLGLCPFADFQKVDKAVRVKAPKFSMLRAEVMLARMLEQYKYDEEEDDEPSTEDIIETATGAPPQRWFKGEIPKPDPNHGSVVSAIRTLTADTAYRADTTRHTLYLVSQTPEDIAWVKDTASAMLGDSINVISALLPANTHGPQESLPENDKNTMQRFNARRREWDKFVQSIGIPKRAMVLVHAPQWFGGGEEGKRRKDDFVNKPAARRVLAEHGCTVQYLLPSEQGKVKDFLTRAQMALLDLVFGHGGLVWGLKQATAACFGGIPPAPRWVGAVGSLEVKNDKWTGKHHQLVLVATKLECSTGKAWVRFAHQGAGAVQTDWMRFDEGARYLAKGRVELPRTYPDKQVMLSQFFVDTFDKITADDPNAVVFIDSTRLAKKVGATWLSDTKMSGENLVTKGISAAQRWPTLRLIRIREQTPTIGQEEKYSSPEGDSVCYWTSTKRLFRVGGASTPTFWSLATPSTHHKRGASCYREMLLRPNKFSENAGLIMKVPAKPEEQHMNPRAVEIVILQKQAGDDDVRLASFAQYLRAGMFTARNVRWATVPTPLRIIYKLAEYMEA
ncbi:MAG: DUF3962 domain-containing protein [Betaproteobacteria bacterium]|nr:DUF3962 domain-containing protein [Betaproteobacteria bacterium]